MNGSCSSSFKSLRKFLYLNLDVGDSRFKSVRGRIYKFDFGTGVANCVGLNSLCAEPVIVGCLGSIAA